MLVRRIRSSELPSLRTLLKRDDLWPDLAAHVRNHPDWLQRALKDLQGERLVVFGVFTPIPDWMAGGFEATLVACLFLKTTPFQESAELKGLAVAGTLLGEGLLLDDMARQRLVQSVASRLVEKAIRHCQVREIPKLEIELPQEESPLLTLFLTLAFRVVAIRQKYLPGKLVCVLERRLGTVYAADPFDHYKVGRWFLRAILDCHIESHSVHDGFMVLYFRAASPHPDLRTSSWRGTRHPLTGALVVLQEGDCDPEDLKRLCRTILSPTSVHVRYALLTCDDPSARRTLERKGIATFELPDLVRLGGGASSSLAVPFGRTDIGGVATVLEYETVREYSAHASFVYYLLSGVGTAVEVASDGPTPLLAIFCPDFRDNTGGPPRPAIVGYAEIRELASQPYSKVKNRFRGVPSALSTADLRFYRAHGDAEQLVALKCDRIRLFATPLPIPDVPSGGASGAEVPAEEWRYLHNELVANLTSAAYFSRLVADYLKLLPEVTTPSTDVGPSFTWIPGDTDEVEQALFRSPDIVLSLEYLHGAVRTAGATCKVLVSETAGVGSGVLVSPSAVLTCCHVVSSGGTAPTQGEITLRFQGLEGHLVTVSGRVSRADALRDLALVEIEDGSLLRSRGVQPVKVCAGVPVRGDDITVIHHPFGESLKVSMSRGGVVNVNAVEHSLHYLTGTAAGSSGGPCFDKEWRLVGIHRAERAGATGRRAVGVLASGFQDLLTDGGEG